MPDQRWPRLMPVKAPLLTDHSAIVPSVEARSICDVLPLTYEPLPRIVQLNPTWPSPTVSTACPVASYDHIVIEAFESRQMESGIPSELKSPRASIWTIPSTGPCAGDHPKASMIWMSV